ncbi:MAG: hypothetical protein IIA63_03015 [Nitrospinae bacterium]|nr:hypothetical protein [Nitrospinota bacterium]
MISIKKKDTKAKKKVTKTKKKTKEVTHQPIGVIETYIENIADWVGIGVSDVVELLGEYQTTPANLISIADSVAILIMNGLAVDQKKLKEIFGDHSDAVKQKQLREKLEELASKLRGITGSDLYLKTADALATVIGSETDIDALVKKAKAGGKASDKAFAKLIQIMTPMSCNGAKGLLFPVILPDMGFYSQGWVQERLRDGFKTNKNSLYRDRFTETFWKAIFAGVSDNPVIRANQRDLKLEFFIAIKKDDWIRDLESGVKNYPDFERECDDAGYLEERKNGEPQDESTFRHYFMDHGVKRRGKGK